MYKLKLIQKFGKPDVLGIGIKEKEPIMMGSYAMIRFVKDLKRMIKRATIVRPFF